LLILGVSLFALIDALITLATGGRALVLGPALVYAAVATTACGLVMLVLRRVGHGLASPLVEADIGNWTVNTLISAGVFAAFVLAFVFESLAMSTAARYVDPVLVGLVVLVSLGVPIRMAGRGLLALLNRSAPEAVTASIEALVKDALGALPARAIYLRVVQPGRTTYVTLHVLLDEAGADLDLRTADRLRVAVVEALARKHAPIIVDIVFTTIEEYAAPTTGFVVAPAQEGST
jgi:predicted Co/Zn/Cd cation transporter (cation efflux family)